MVILEEFCSQVSSKLTTSYKAVFR